MTGRQAHLVEPPVKRRLHCAACLRPQNACICTWVTPVAHQVEVLILQHPLEANNPKGSARLLHLCLPNSRLLVGEVFADDVMRAGPPRRALLLYPGMPQDLAQNLKAPPVLAPEALCEPGSLRLVVLDGTWRKSRKMLYLNPVLQQLPRLSLQGLPPSSYRIRKAHQPDQLSTLEATCAALIQLEGDADKFQPLLTAFDAFVAQQMGYWQGAEPLSGRQSPGEKR